MLKDILQILEKDARVSSRQIATMTGLSAGEVDRLVKQAEKDRIILKYKTVVNWDRVEENEQVWALIEVRVKPEPEVGFDSIAGRIARYEQVWALIEVRVKPEPEVGFDSIAGRIARYEQVRSLFLASGTYDLLLVVVDKTERKVADFVSQNLSHIQGVQGTVTHFVLKRYKDDGEILEGGEAVTRQPVIL